MANNVTRFLESRKIPYTALNLPVEKRSALETAENLGVDPLIVYKTLVVQRENGKPILAVVPGPFTLNLKVLAVELGEKKVHFPTEREAERLTGLQVGGISPLALLTRGFTIILDSSAQNLDEFIISGGRRGLFIRMRVHDFVTITQAQITSITS